MALIRNERFGFVISEFRKKNKLTQENMVDFIRSKSNLFAKVDSITVSRWERGVTAPPLVKKIELLLLLDFSVEQILKLVIKQPSDTKKLNSYLADSYLSSDIDITAHKISLENFYEIKEVEKEVDLICIYEKSEFLDMFVKYTAAEKKIIFRQLDLNICLYIANGRLMGHLVHICVPKNTHWQILNGEIDLVTLAQSSLRGANTIEKITTATELIIVSVNCTHNKVFDDLFGQFFNVFLFNYKNSNLSCLYKDSKTKTTLQKLGFASHTYNVSSTISWHDAIRTKAVLELVRLVRS